MSKFCFGNVSFTQNENHHLVMTSQLGGYALEFLDNGLRSAAAHSFHSHVCRPSCIFSDVHAAGKNDRHFFRACGRETLRGVLAYTAVKVMPLWRLCCILSHTPACRHKQDVVVAGARHAGDVFDGGHERRAGCQIFILILRDGVLPERGKVLHHIVRLVVAQHDAEKVLVAGPLLLGLVQNQLRRVKIRTLRRMLRALQK